VNGSTKHAGNINSMFVSKKLLAMSFVTLEINFTKGCAQNVDISSINLQYS